MKPELSPQRTSVTGDLIKKPLPWSVVTVIKVTLWFWRGGCHLSVVPHQWGRHSFAFWLWHSAFGLWWNLSMAFIVIMVEGALLQAQLEFCKHVLEHTLKILKRGFQEQSCLETNDLGFPFLGCSVWSQMIAVPGMQSAALTLGFQAQEKQAAYFKMVLS